MHWRPTNKSFTFTLSHLLLLNMSHMWHSCYKWGNRVTFVALWKSYIALPILSYICQPRPCLTFMKWDTECTDSRSCCSFSQWAAVGMEVASRHSPHLTTQHISYYRYYRHCVFSVLSNSPQLVKFLTPADTSKSEKNVVVVVLVLWIGDSWFVLLGEILSADFDHRCLTSPAVIVMNTLSEVIADFTFRGS